MKNLILLSVLLTSFAAFGEASIDASSDSSGRRSVIGIGATINSIHAPQEVNEYLEEPNQGPSYSNAGGGGKFETKQFVPTLPNSCLVEQIKSVTEYGCEKCNGDACDNSFKDFPVYKKLDRKIDFESIYSCQEFFGGENAGYTVADEKFLNRACQIVASICKLPPSVSTANPDQIKKIKSSYDDCVKAASEKNLRGVLVGMQKCEALREASAATNASEEGPRVQSMDGKIFCRPNSGMALDYKSCTDYITWYNNLLGAELGVNTLNTIEKNQTGMRAQQDAAVATQQGNGQVAGVDASRRVTMASANAEGKSKIFFFGKAGAITQQLLTFVTPENIEQKCESECCALFNSKESEDDGFRNTARYFPNSELKSVMLGEVITAGGQAAVAAMNEEELKRQASAMQAVQQQLVEQNDNTVEGVMKYCIQFPTDAKCLGAGVRLPTKGSQFQAPSFSAQNFGLGNLNPAAAESITIEEGSAGAVGSDSTGSPVADLGSMGSDIKEAKNTFDAPPAAGGGSGGKAPAAAGGGSGGGGANASANSLSNDPGVQGEKKESSIKTTSTTASYEGSGPGYNGGGYRAGAAKKEDAAANPFASMFAKDKGRTPSSEVGVDGPISDLFKKLSDRYGKVMQEKRLNYEQVK